MFGWVWWQNSSKRHLKIDRSRFFIFLEINEKKGVLKQNPLNNKSRKLVDELCGRQQCKFKIIDDQMIILPLKNVDHGNDQVWTKINKKATFCQELWFFSPVHRFSSFLFSGSLEKHTSKYASTETLMGQNRL